MPPRRKRTKKKAATPVELSESEQPEDDEPEDEDSDYSPATHGKGASADDDAPGPLKRSRKTTSKTTGKTTSKTVVTKNSRVRGKLSKLMELPLDIFFEITAKLEPVDILHLSRVSKHFRSMLRPTNARHAWIASRRNIPSLPDCPPDLNEAQYAALLFEHACHSCGTGRAKKVDYALRVRYCASCFMQNVKKGTMMKRIIGPVPDEVFTLVARSIIKCVSDIHNPSSANNKFNAYHVGQLADALLDYNDILEDGDDEDVESFIAAKQREADAIIQHALKLVQWEDDYRDLRSARDLERSHSREQSIIDKLLELGWERQFIPTGFDYEWNALATQPRELTPRIWKQIEPKLLTILHKRRHDYLGSQVRLSLTRTWNTFKASAGSPCPTMVDVIRSPVVIDIFDEDPQLSDVTEDTIASVMAAAPLIGEAYRLKIKHDLFKILEDARTHFDGTGRDPSQVSESEIDKVVLSATAMFICSQWDHRYHHNNKPRHSFPYADLIKHLQESHPDTAWNISEIQPDLETEKMAIWVLGILELPVDTSMKDLEEMGKFRCLCDHPRASGPLSFAALIHHIMLESTWYKDRFFHVQPTSGVYDDHALDKLDALIKMIPRRSPEEMETETEISSPPTSNSTSDDKIISCLLCRRQPGWNSFISTQFTSVEEMEYHMKAKHHSGITSTATGSSSSTTGPDVPAASSSASSS